MSANVFLSHTTADKPAVEELARRLRDKEGIQAWLDKWNLVPGAPWQPAIEEALADSETCAVFIGPSGLSPWQTEEMRVAINRRVTDTQQRFRVIPVFLPGAKRDSLPPLLVAGTWVEFHDSLDEPDAFHRLVCGIRGVAPRPGEAEAPGSPRTLHNLPFAPNPAFTGREVDLERLGEHLQMRGGVALTQTVALHGLGGVGKTQLAVEYAWKHLGGYTAVLWVRADSPEALEANLAVLAGLLGLPEASEKKQDVQTNAVLKWLNDHERWLLIADNADTDEAVRAVRNRVRPHLRGHLLVTSRLGRWPVNMTHLALELLSRQDATRYLQTRVAKEGHEAGNETAAQQLAEELGYLPLALEQAASFLIELRSSFDHYREQLRTARPELLVYPTPGGTDYPEPVAKTWSITLKQLSPLARALLCLAAWFAPEAIPRGIFTANKDLLSEALDGNALVSELAVERALGDLARFSLVRLSPETVSVHRLLQAVEQDSPSGGEPQRWIKCAAELLIEFELMAPGDFRERSVWLSLRSHAEALLEHAKRHVIETPRIALLANQFGLFLLTGGAYAQAEPVFGHALAIFEKALGPENPFVGNTVDNLGELYRAQGQYGKAEPLYHRARAIREKAFGPDHPSVALSLNNLGLLYRVQGQYGKAEPLYQGALAIQEKALGPEHPDVGTSVDNLAELYRAQGQYGKAEPLYHRALAILEKALGPEHHDVGTSLNNLAVFYEAQGRYAQAETLYQRALAIREKALGPEHPYVGTSLNNLAELYRVQGQYGKAEPLHQRALAIREKALGPDHPNVAQSLNNLAGLCYAQGRYTHAETLYHRALAIYEKALGPVHPDVAASLSSLAVLYTAQSQCAEAEPLFRRALAIFEKALGPDHPDLATSLNGLAGLYCGQGQFLKAKPLYQRARAIREKAFGPDHPNVATSLHSLAVLYSIQGRHAKAKSLYERALAIYEKALVPEHPDVATLLENYAFLLRNMGWPEKAAQLEARAKAIRANTLRNSKPSN